MITLNRPAAFACLLSAVRTWVSVPPAFIPRFSRKDLHGGLRAAHHHAALIKHIMRHPRRRQLTEH